MEIRLGSELISTDNMIACLLESARHVGGVEISFSKIKADTLRFMILDPSTGRAASSKAHDEVIHEALSFDPKATIRTSRAIYVGLSDFLRQKEARQ